MSASRTVANRRMRGGMGAGFVPPRATAFLRKRAMNAFGLSLIILAVALFAACLFYHPADPSLNSASGGPVYNLLGVPGAYAADLVLQTFGIVGLLVPILIAAWGWRLLWERTLPRWWLRLSLVPAVLLLASVAANALPRPATWPLAGGLGGAGGALLSDELARFMDAQEWITAIAAAVLAGVAFFFALGFSSSEWQAIRRAFSWLTVGTGQQLGRWLPPPGVFEWFGSDDERSKPQREEPRLFEAAVAPGEEPRSRAKTPKDTAPISHTREPTKLAREASDGARRSSEREWARETGKGPPDYEFPSLAFLDAPRGPSRGLTVSKEVLESNARSLESVLDDFGVRGEIVKICPGPVVTRYELEPAPGTKTSRVVGLADDIARSMSAVSVRVAVVPGHSTIGIELPNGERETVYLRGLLGSEMYERVGGKLPLILGRDISGASVMVDLARMPHLLIAGTTGSGKSVAINAMILSLLYRLSPVDCKFIMVDPKMLELSVYDDIPHLLSPVVTDPKKAIVALKWTVREMEERYRAMSLLGVRNIDGYNARVGEAKRTGEVLTRRVQTGFDIDTGQPVHEEEALELEPLPYIVVVVDEMADLMLVAGKDIEVAVQRLAQMARAAGIHLIMATQRPSVDVITGTIKANFPTRISFHVTSKIDSRTILGETGAEQLLGQGDMLYMAHGGRITRVHAPRVTDQEVEKVVAFLKKQGRPSYIDAITDEDELGINEFGFDTSNGGDDLYDRAVALVCHERKASTSFIQRHLQIGYNRAARIIEQMEAEGVVSAANHVGKREVLVHRPKEDA